MPFEIVRNDITLMKVDAIVNAANKSLLGGGGVDGAIHAAAGPKLLEACRKLNGCETGEAKITKGYDLPAKYVIHTVGPIWHGGQNGEEELLKACYRNSLELALAHKCESIAFPMISAGAYGYPADQAMSVAVESIRAFLTDHDMTVYLIVFGRQSFRISQKLFRDVQEYIDDVYADAHDRKNLRDYRAAMWREAESEAQAFDEKLMAVPKARRMEMPMPCAVADTAAPKDLDELLKKTDEGFSEALLRLIDEKGMTDIQCYKRANVDRKLFSKIRSNSAYKPSKPTACAFAVALKLSLPETRNLLQKAGFALTHSSKFDIILEYFIQNRNYDVYEINCVLFEYDMPLLGSGIN